MPQHTDKFHADVIRQRVEAVRYAIMAAREDGLTVHVPELTHLYFDGGTASGAPNDWQIYRQHQANVSACLFAAKSRAKYRQPSINGPKPPR